MFQATTLARGASLCCAVQLPFVITKTGPVQVKTGEAFNYDVNVVFLDNAKGVKILDALPDQLTPSSTQLATWTAITTTGGTSSGGG